jgi:hypothetical protein
MDKTPLFLYILLLLWPNPNLVLHNLTMNPLAAGPGDSSFEHPPCFYFRQESFARKTYQWNQNRNWQTAWADPPTKRQENRTDV